MSKDDLGDRMKGYEQVETGRLLDCSLPIYARIDGRSFSKFTKNMTRPFDHKFSNAMIETTKELVEKTDAILGFVQSDEISLLWYIDYDLTPNREMFFAGKVSKLTSILASMTTAIFIKNICVQFGSSILEKIPHFDARVCNLPSTTEAHNMLLWRELDAKRNAISMTAHHYFSHKSLQNVGMMDQLKMLEDNGICFSSFPIEFRRGTYVFKVQMEKEMTETERMSIPEQFRPEVGQLFSMASITEDFDPDNYLEDKSRSKNIVDVYFERIKGETK